MNFFRTLILLPLLCLSNLAYAKDKALDIELEDGVSYETIRGAQSTSKDGKIEVVEYFWYGCPHCYEFMPYLLEWEKTIANDVVFKPVAFAGSRPRWQLDALVFFAAEALELPDSYHQNYFLARHSKGKKNTVLEPEDIADFFVDLYGKSHKFDREKFINVMESFSVQSRSRAEFSKARRLGINSVPEIVVDGRFRVRRETAGTYANITKIVDRLLELVRRDLSVIAQNEAAKAQKKAQKKAQEKPSKPSTKKPSTKEQAQPSKPKPTK